MRVCVYVCIRARVRGSLAIVIVHVQLGNSDVKAQLKANTEEAVAAGAFGSPYFIVQGGREPFAEPFTVFGSDRFEQIACVDLT